MAPSSDFPRVKTRRVHYFSGFDPRGAGHYHRLYREEAQKQSCHNKARLQIGPRERRNEFVSAWRVAGAWNGETASTDYQFMHWDDLVRANWQRSPWLLWVKGLWPYVQLLTCGAWVRIRSVAKPVATSGAFPMALLLLFLLLACFGAVGTGFAAFFIGWGWPAVIMSGAIVAMLVLWAGALVSEKMGGHWLLRTFLFVYRWGQGDQQDLDWRLDEFCRHIIEEQRCNPVDEVLLVGHSIGTMLAVDVAARFSKQYPTDCTGVKLLTLGQCIPVLSFIPKAAEFRNALEVLATAKTIPWTDVTIPPDPLCFYRLDPVKLSGLSDPCHRGPRLAVARVFRMFSEQTYSKLRWNKLRLHFQYIMASELSADYDYFLTTAGPLFLDDSLANCEILSFHD